MIAKKRAQRPVDLKDMPWSHIGKDALDAAAERLWNEALRGPGKPPYHMLNYALDGTDQEIIQQSVLNVLGFAVPALLRQRAKELRRNGAESEEYAELLDLADELEEEHGGRAVKPPAVYNINSGARRVWNALVSEYGIAVVDYLKDIAAVAGPCNAAWGTEGHRARLEQVDAAIYAAMADLCRWAKPLF